MAVVDNSIGATLNASGLDLKTHKVLNQSPGTVSTDGAALANSLDQFAAPAANVAMNSKKLTGLANGTVATDAAAYGQIPIINGAAGPTPCSFTQFTEDWMIQNSAPINNGIVQGSGLFCDASGGSGAFQTSSAAARGVLRYTATTAAQYYGFLAGGGNNKCIVIQSSDYVYLSTRVAIPTALSDGTNTYLHWWGLTASAEAYGVDSIIMGHDIAVDTTHWIFQVAVGSVVTSLASTVTITLGQFYILEMIKPSGSSTWTCYVDGVSQGTIAATPSNAVYPSSYIKKTLGSTARSADVDWVHGQVIESSGRASSFLR